MVTVIVSLACGFAGTIETACIALHKANASLAARRDGLDRALWTAATCFAHGSVDASLVGIAGAPMATVTSTIPPNLNNSTVPPMLSSREVYIAASGRSSGGLTTPPAPGSARTATQKWMQKEARG